MNMQPVLLFLHISSVTVWVGGMFFAYMCLRPSAAVLLDPPLRLKLWQGVLSRFFVWVWGAVSLILVSGLTMLAQQGMRYALPGTHLMLVSGLIMVGIFIYVAIGPHRALGRAVVAEDWKAGGQALNRIRQMVSTNLLIGLFTIAFATLGRYFA